MDIKKEILNGIPARIIKKKELQKQHSRQRSCTFNTGYGVIGKGKEIIERFKINHLTNKKVVLYRNKKYPEIK